MCALRSKIVKKTVKFRLGGVKGVKHYDSSSLSLPVFPLFSPHFNSHSVLFLLQFSVQPPVLYFHDVVSHIFVFQSPLFA